MSKALTARATVWCISLLFAAACGSSSGGQTVTTVETARGDECPNGGHVIRVGVDDSGDGRIEDADVEHEVVICDGSDGDPGLDGADADCEGREPVEVSAAYLVEGGPYLVGRSAALRVVARGEDLAFEVVGAGVAAGEFEPVADDDTYEAEVTFTQEGGPFTNAVVAHGACSLDAEAFEVEQVATPVDIELAIGEFQACGVGPDHLSCWGSSEQALVETAPTLWPGELSNLAITHDGAFSAHGCGIHLSRRLYCWGRDDEGEVSEPNAADGLYDDVDVRSGVTCAVRSSDGRIDCFGDVGTTEDGPMAHAIEGDGPYASLALGKRNATHACAVRSDDQRIECWGTGEPGEWPEQVTGPNESTAAYRKVALAQDQVCAIRVDDGTVECWAEEEEEEEEEPASDAASQEEPPSDAVRDVAASQGGFCAVMADDGAIDCWGTGAIVEEERPTDTGFLRVYAGGRFNANACAVHEDEYAICWGQNQYGVTDLPEELAKLD